MHLINSFWAVLGRDIPEPKAVVAERVRAAMLAALAHRCAGNHIKLHLKIQFALGLDALWYLRSDLMIAISSCQGEMPAKKVLNEITRMFVGYHPDAKQSRSGFLTLGQSDI